MQRFVVSALVVLLSVLVPVGEAASQDFMQGSRPTGMGGAFTSIATGPTGMYHNPAGIATARMYAVGGTYEYTPSGNVLNASIVDSKTNPRIAAEAGYSYLIGHGDNDPSGHDIRLALAVPAMPDRISVGIGGRYMILKRGGAEFARGFTLDAGFLFQLAEKFQLGLSGKNLIDVCQNPRCLGVAPMTVAAGASYGSRKSGLRLAADFGVDINSEPDDVNFLIEAGGEYLIGGSVPLRVGYTHETLDTSNHVTGGVGWRASRFGIDASGDVNVNSPEDFTISASFSVFFN